MDISNTHTQTFILIKQLNPCMRGTDKARPKLYEGDFGYVVKKYDNLTLRAIYSVYSKSSFTMKNEFSSARVLKLSRG